MEILIDRSIDRAVPGHRDKRRQRENEREREREKERERDKEREREPLHVTELANRLPASAKHFRGVPVITQPWHV